MGIRRTGRRKRRRGVPSMAIRSDDITQAEARAFWLQLDIPLDESECWNWNQPKQRKRRGKPNPSPRINWRGKCIQAHRVAWELRHGSVPSGMKVRRTCRNLTCCNPAHMELGKGGKPQYLSAQEQRQVMHLWRTSNLSSEAIGERFGVTQWVVDELLKREL